MYINPLSKGGLAVGIILLFMGACMIPSAAQHMEKPFLLTLHGNWLYVGGGGTGNYTKIQDAIDNVSDGGTVFVYDDLSPYYENIFIDKSITLTGENRYSTIIDGNSTGNVVEIYAKGVIISNFTLQGCGNKEGNEAGIHTTADYVEVTNNIIRDNRHDGISLVSSSHCTISNNIFINNRYDGIDFTENSHSNTVYNNDIESGVSGIYICASNQQVISYNKITNCSKGIYLTECSGNTVIRNHLIGNTEGLFSYYAIDNTIQCNNFISNERHARFAKFFHIGFLAPDKWNENYWDDWKKIGGKYIFGAIYVQTVNLIGLFIPWIEVDWHPATEPYEW